MPFRFQFRVQQWQFWKAHEYLSVYLRKARGYLSVYLRMMACSENYDLKTVHISARVLESIDRLLYSLYN